MIDWKNVPDTFKPRHIKEEKTTKHTATPWILKTAKANTGPSAPVGAEIRSGNWVIFHLGNLNTDLQFTNAEFIVRACNAHEELVEKLKEANRYLIVIAGENEDPGAAYLSLEIEEAIAKAEGRET